MGGSVHVHSFVSLLVSDSKISGVPHLYTPNTWSWRRQWHPTPVLLPGKSHGRRSLVGCNPWGCKELDTTEWLHLHFSLSCIGEGNGNPLQRSCLENPRDRGAWWAAVYGVPQSRTRMKWLSSGNAWRIPGRGSLVGCRLWGRTELDTTEATQQQQQQWLLMLGGIGGRRRRGRQRMRWLDGITNSMHMSWGNSGSWWWTGRPGVLRFMRSQRVGHDWATDLNGS